MEVLGTGEIFCRFRRGEKNLVKEATDRVTSEGAGGASATDANAMTPVMRQYFAAKEAHPDCLMFCRIGDFYELFYEDAMEIGRAHV